MIIGCDISHHQGEAIDWNKMAAAGVKFIYIKCSQGINIKDHDFEANMKGARSFGILPGPYHFVTTDNPYKQYEWFLRCMGNFMFSLPPAVDVEQRGVTEAIVDSIGRHLTNWMEDQDDMVGYGYKYPTIYTNNGMGNAIFKSKSMARYPLWIAHWPRTVPLTKPTLPSVWKGGPYFIWQDKVLPSGSEYGVPGALDHDVWGTLYPFPDAPQKRVLSLTGTGKDGAKWTGKMEVA